MAEIKLIALDLDGTLFRSDGTISQASIDAINYASSKALARLWALFYTTIALLFQNCPFLRYLWTIFKKSPIMPQEPKLRQERNLYGRNQTYCAGS